MTTAPHPSFYALDALLLGARVGVGVDDVAVSAHVRDCPRCAAYLTGDPAVPVPAWLAGVVLPPAPVRKPGRGRPWFWPLVSAAAMASVAVLGVLNWRSAAPSLGDRVPAPPGEVREGSPALRVFIKRGGRVFPWDGRGAIRPDDKLRFEVHGAGAGFISVALRPAGAAAVILYEGQLAAGAQLLPLSFRVDENGSEEIVSVIIDRAAIAAGLHVQAAEPAGGGPAWRQILVLQGQRRRRSWPKPLPHEKDTAMKLAKLAITAGRSAGRSAIKVVALLGLAAGVMTSASPAAGAEATANRVAIVVGANAAAPGRKPLYYGHRDAEKVGDVLTSVGGFRREDVHVLRDPSVELLLNTLLDAISQLDSKRESLLYFYYSGHADEQALYPAGRPVPLEKLRGLLDRARVSVRIGMVDACRGGSWTRAKGLVPDEPFAVRWPLSLDNEGSVLIASSSGLESAHESDELQGSFFTHHFVAGLRGGADRNANGEVTLTEAFEFAKERTIRDSLRSTREAQHPSYAVNLRGRRDLVLAQIASGTSTVEIGQSSGPLELIHAESGIELLELPAGQRRVKLAVPPGQYLIRKHAADGGVLIKEVAVKAGATSFVDEDHLALVGSTRLIAKAAAPAPVSFGPTFVTVPGSPAVAGALAASAPLGPRPTPTWVKTGTVVSAIAAALAAGMTYKFYRDVESYNEMLDPLRRFPCNPDDKTFGCDKNGASAKPLRPEQIDYRTSLSDEGKTFQRHQMIALATTAVFTLATIPFAYRWIRGEKADAVATTGQADRAWLLLPVSAGRPGLAALGTF